MSPKTDAGKAVLEKAARDLHYRTDGSREYLCRECLKRSATVLGAALAEATTQAVKHPHKDEMNEWLTEEERVLEILEDACDYDTAEEE